MDDRLERQLDFRRERDGLKPIKRQTWLMDTSRKPNSAEHAWHVAVLWRSSEQLLDRAVAKGIRSPSAP